MVPLFAALFPSVAKRMTMTMSTNMNTLIIKTDSGIKGGKPFFSVKATLNGEELLVHTLNAGSEPTNVNCKKAGASLTLSERQFGERAQHYQLTLHARDDLKMIVNGKEIPAGQMVRLVRFSERQTGKLGEWEPKIGAHKRRPHYSRSRQRYAHAS